MNETNNDTDILSKMTEEAIRQRIPCIIFIGSLSVIGIIGNIHVLILFSTTNWKPSTYTVFVRALSIVDLMTCVVHMPIEILDLMIPYKFYSEVGCKLFRLNNAFLIMSSASILILIAMERHRRVCNPMKTQMTVSVSKWMCVLAIFISLLISLPMYFLTGHHLVTLEGHYGNVTGYMCFISDKVHGTIFLYSYLGFMIIIYIMTSLILVIAYVSISKVVFSRNAKILRCQKSKETLNDISTISGLDPNGSYHSEHLPSDLYHNCSLGFKHQLKSTTFKTTRPLIFITAIFITVFAPYMILNVVNSLDKNFKTNMNNIELTLYQIGVRLLLINNVSNPFVYGFTDARFKNGIKAVYCKRC